MSDIESLMWTLESDPYLSSNFANISILDRAPDIARLRSRLWRATRTNPRLRRRVRASFGPATPSWQEDPDFDLDHHVRRITLPRGSTDADARAIATDIALTPFDDDRPLWEFTVIEGLPKGRAAMVQKMHHTITDGKGGIRMSLSFIDFERDAPDPEPIDGGPPAIHDAAPPAGLGAMLMRNAEQAIRQFQSQVGSATGALAGALTNPGHLASVLSELPVETAATLQSAIRQFGVIGSHKSPLWTERSLRRELQVFDIPLAEVKAAATALGGSVNDLFVAAAAGGAGAYHREFGHEVHELRMSMPVSTRTDKAVGGNAFTPTRVLVPVIEDPAQRFAAIHERLTVTKSERSIALLSPLMGMGRLVPRGLLVKLARQQVMTVDFTTSNLRAAPFDLFIAGAMMEHNYPLGPIMGTAWNLTTMSYRGNLNLGLHVDTAAVEHPERLAVHIVDAFAELIALGS